MANENIPIDIQCGKVVDWLIDRRHCNIKWQTAAEVVKKKINAALKDMPSTPEMQTLLKGSCFHYYKCRKIVNELEDTEKDTKNIFGMYSSQRMKDWKEILKLYCDENLYLAELSSRLLRNINYEIPALKRHITRCGQLQQESRRKITECEKNTNEGKRRYTEECKKLGIDGINVKKELINLVKDLPKELNDVADECKGIQPAIEYYKAFVCFILSNDNFADDILPMCRHICCHGNTTVYHWIHKEEPLSVVRDEILVDGSGTDEDDNDEIDWGFDEGGDDVIDFDINVEECGIVLEEGNDDVVLLDLPADQNNGFEIVDAVANGEEQDWKIEEVGCSSEVVQDSQEEKVARGNEALTLLECGETRSQFLNELLELIGFLNQRICESKLDVDILSLNLFQDAPQILQLTSTEEIEKFLSRLTSSHDRLTSTKMTYLLRILDSPRFVDRVAENLSKINSLAGKYSRQILRHEGRIEELSVEEASLHPQLQVAISESKEWQKLIEDDISKRYKDRPVHLLGSINTL